MTDMRYCTATKVLTRRVVVPPEGGLFATAPNPPSREEIIRCAANRSDKHSCVGPFDHDGPHLCACHWMWSRG